MSDFETLKAINDLKRLVKQSQPKLSVQGIEAGRDPSQPIAEEVIKRPVIRLRAKKDKFEGFREPNYDKDDWVPEPPKY